MSRECVIEGTVIWSAGRRVKVETSPVDACASCGGKMLCSSGKVRILELETDTAFTGGEKVELGVARAAGATATFFLYAAGTVLGLIAALMAYFIFNQTEVTAAVLFIATEIICFLLASMGLRRYLKNKITIKKLLDSQ